MKVEILYRNDPERPLTDPLPELGGRRFVFRLYSGDYCDPIGGSWFDPKDLPRFVLRAWLPLMPFVAWRWPFTERAGYIGFKVYGADSPEYLNWMKADDVSPTSQATCFSIRLSANLGRG